MFAAKSNATLMLCGLIRTYPGIPQVNQILFWCFAWLSGCILAPGIGIRKLGNPYREVGVLPTRDVSPNFSERFRWPCGRKG